VPSPGDRSDRIDRTKIEHVWAQVADDLRERIDAGELAAGHRLRSEQDLAEEYGVARLTVRRAISVLVEEGRLIVLRGRGTYVKERQ
jgi:DNA-binding GntR family transcriptional regulator